MIKKSKKLDETVVIENTPEVLTTPSSTEVSILGEFDIAELNNQKKRHQTIGSLFDRAADVIGNYLDDPSTDLTAKMFPAKLATDIYLAQEKFRREDERIELEKRKLALDELKSGKQLPPGSKFIQNNNYYSTTPQQDKHVDIADLKKRQEELLSSYLPDSKNS